MGRMMECPHFRTSSRVRDSMQKTRWVKGIWNCAAWTGKKLKFQVHFCWWFQFPLNTSFWCLWLKIPISSLTNTIVLSFNVTSLVWFLMWYHQQTFSLDLVNPHRDPILLLHTVSIWFEYLLTPIFGQMIQPDPISTFWCQSRSQAVRKPWWHSMSHPGYIINRDPYNGLIKSLGGGFKYFFIFTPTWGNDPIWRAYVSTGLVQPPTRSLYKLGRKIHPRNMNFLKQPTKVIKRLLNCSWNIFFWGNSSCIHWQSVAFENLPFFHSHYEA